MLFKGAVTSPALPPQLHTPRGEGGGTLFKGAVTSPAPPPQYLLTPRGEGEGGTLFKGALTSRAPPPQLLTPGGHVV